MSVVETVLVVIALINIIVLILTFIMYTSLISIKIYINQMHVGMATILGKVMALESVTSKLATGFTEAIGLTEEMLARMDTGSIGHSNQIYKTKDGKYTAKTLDELLNKIKDDDAESEYFSDFDVDKLRDLFEEDDDEEDYDGPLDNEK